MTTTTIRKVPRSLPHARIYLDDLFEIENLLRDEFSKRYDAASISFEYVVDNSISMTTHDELVEHGGYATHFSLSASAGSRFLGSALLNFDGNSAPFFSLPYDSRESEWALYGKVNEIFHARRDWLKNFYESVPGWLIFGLWAVMFVVGSLIQIIVPKDPGIRPLLEPYLALMVIPLVFIGLALVVLFRKNRIYLRLARQDQKARAAARRERIGKLLWLLAGSIIGVAATFVADRFRR